MLARADEAHSTQSSTREKMLEHLFVADLLRCLWRRSVRVFDVLRPEVDKSGYDLVLETDHIIRYVQLKSSHRAAKTREVGINTALARKPSGCVVWIQFDPATLELGPFLWFGGPPGAKLPPLGDRVGKHTKGDRTGFKSERPRIRLLRRSQFDVLPTMDAVVHALFGL